LKLGRDETAYVMKCADWMTVRENWY
jgi:hypothetical protein